MIPLASIYYTRHNRPAAVHGRAHGRMGMELRCSRPRAVRRFALALRLQLTCSWLCSVRVPSVFGQCSVDVGVPSMFRRCSVVPSTPHPPSGICGWATHAAPLRLTAAWGFHYLAHMVANPGPGVPLTARGVPRMMNIEYAALF